MHGKSDEPGDILHQVSGAEAKRNRRLICAQFVEPMKRELLLLSLSMHSSDHQQKAHRLLTSYKGSKVGEFSALSMQEDRRIVLIPRR